MAEMEIFSGNMRVSSSRTYSDEYKTIVFEIWYNNNKPTAEDLLTLIPKPETNFGKLPSRKTLYTWIYDDFAVRARSLDAGVRETIDRTLVEAKVDMLKRHVVTAHKMQDIALEYLEDHKDELSSSAAVRLLVEGVRIERESVGIPAMLDKMAAKSDEQLLEEVKKLFIDSPIEFEKEDEQL